MNDTLTNAIQVINDIGEMPDESYDKLSKTIRNGISKPDNIRRDATEGVSNTVSIIARYIIIPIIIIVILCLVIGVLSKTINLVSSIIIFLVIMFVAWVLYTMLMSSLQASLEEDSKKLATSSANYAETITTELIKGFKEASKEYVDEKSARSEVSSSSSSSSSSFIATKQEIDDLEFDD